MQDVTAIVQLTRRRRTAEHGESTAREEARLSAMQAETQARAEARLRRVCEQAPVAMCVMRGPKHVYEVANPRHLDIVGHRPIIGLSVREAFPEIAGQGIYELLDDTYTSGQRCYAHERPITVARGPGGALEEVFYDFVYEPLLDADGAIEGITAVVTDVTERVRARAVVEQAEAERERLTALERAAGQRAEAAEALLGRVYQQAPVAIAVLRGPEHRFEVAKVDISRPVAPWARAPRWSSVGPSLTMICRRMQRSGWRRDQRTGWEPAASCSWPTTRP